jgi:hypothetical protein
MKRLFTLLALLLTTSLYLMAQCPNAAYQNGTLGFFPATSVDCGFTFSSIADSLVTYEIVPGSPTDVTVYFDAFKIIEITGLPTGISASTDVINTADPNGPYGYWLNQGNVPIQTEVLGCLSFIESGTTFSSLSTSGPNGNGTYPITITFDLRVAGTNPDISSVIHNGSWYSTIPLGLGGGVVTYERLLDVNNCISTGPCSPPSVLFAGLNSSYTLSDSPAVLIGAPSGGTFFGNGIFGNEFDPSVAGVGNHGITYVYIDNADCMNAYSLCTTVDLNVGIGGPQMTSTEGLDIYPNPSTGSFNLSLTKANGVVSYTVYDAQGKEVAHNAFVAKGSVNRTINLNQNADGVYTIQVVTPTGTVSQKLVKK